MTRPQLDESVVFYDSFDWQKPIEICPSCQVVIEAQNLVFSEEQSAALGRVYRIILDYEGKRRSNGEDS